MKKLLVFLFVLAIIIATPVGINILQNGIGGPDGRTMKEILGKSPSSARFDDINALSKSEIMQLFYAASAPSFRKMNGEYEAELLPKGVLAKVSDFFTHSLMGPGRWEGKAFTPATKSEGWGYNLFSVDRGGQEAIARVVRMDTNVGPSVFDDKDSFHLIYAAYNHGLVNTMEDEIRQINPKLFLGYGYMGWSGGKLNPAPFVLIGPPTPWVGTQGED